MVQVSILYSTSYISTWYDTLSKYSPSQATIRENNNSKEKNTSSERIQYQYNTLCDLIILCHTKLATTRRTTIAIPIHLKREGGNKLYVKLRKIQNDTKQHLLQLAPAQHLALHEFHFNLDDFICSEFIIKSFWLKDNPTENNNTDNSTENHNTEFKHKDNDGGNDTISTTTDEQKQIELNSDDDVIMDMRNTPQDPPLANATHNIEIKSPSDVGITTRPNLHNHVFNYHANTNQITQNNHNLYNNNNSTTPTSSTCTDSSDT